MPTRTGAEPRLAAARVVRAVLDDRRSLGPALEPELAALPAARDRALTRRLAASVLRRHPALERALGRLLSRPLPRRQRLIHHLLGVGLTQLWHLDMPSHAGVNATVEAARLAGEPRMTRLVNGVLRGFQRHRDEIEGMIETDPEARHGHLAWMIECLRRAWPDDWQAVLEACNRPPPRWLRVNRRRVRRDDYLEHLDAAGIRARAGELPDAVVTDHAVAIRDLPGFGDGLVSIQDAGAQMAVDMLDLADGQRVLDACAAPGGKTGHILERVDAQVLAVDADAARVSHVRENLGRLGLVAEVVAADAACPQTWWDGRRFDRILVDAPCSSTGVTRRHPDIRWLRRAADVPGYVADQRRLVAGLWPLVKPGGMLVYATCSVLPEENADQARHFLETLDHVRVETPSHRLARPAGSGRQILPGDYGMDGFFYLALRRLQPG